MSDLMRRCYLKGVVWLLSAGAIGAAIADDASSLAGTPPPSPPLTPMVYCTTQQLDCMSYEATFQYNNFEVSPLIMTLTGSVTARCPPEYVLSGVVTPTQYAPEILVKNSNGVRNGTITCCRMVAVGSWRSSCS